MDLSKLSTSDRVIAASGIVLFISSFLPWFKVDTIIGNFDANGWDVGFLWAGLPALLGLLAAGIVLATRLGSVEMPRTQVSTGQAMLIAGAISAFFVVLKLLIGEDAPWDRAWGLFLATIAALGLLAGGYLAFQEEKGGSGPGR